MCHQVSYPPNRVTQAIRGVRKVYLHQMNAAEATNRPEASAPNQDEDDRNVAPVLDEFAEEKDADEGPDGEADLDAAQQPSLLA